MFAMNMDMIDGINSVDKSKIEEYMGELGDWLVEKAFDLLITFLFLFIGRKICKFIVKLIRRSFEKSGIEPSVAGFLLSLINGILFAVLIIMAASILGFQVTSLVAVLGTAGLAIGLALQGSLANFAGGVLILIMKPFRVGDYIIENDKGCEGTVESIDIFYTKLRTYDNRMIVIPNGNITSHSLINLTAAGTRKLDISVAVSYDSDLELVKKTLEQVLKDCSYREQTCGYDVFVSDFLDSGIKVGIRCMVKTEDYWKARWDILEKIKIYFDNHCIKIPYPHMEVAIKNDEHKIK